jgi:hypothetical protein
MHTPRSDPSWLRIGDARRLVHLKPKSLTPTDGLAPSSSARELRVQGLRLTTQKRRFGPALSCDDFRVLKFRGFGFWTCEYRIDLGLKARILFGIVETYSLHVVGDPARDSLPLDRVDTLARPLR